MTRYITRFAYDGLKNGYMHQIDMIDSIIKRARTDTGKYILVSQQAYWIGKLLQLDEMDIVETSEEWLAKTQDAYKQESK